MKIIHLTRRYQPLRGGVETHVAEVSRCLLAAGHQVEVVTMQTEVRLPLESNQDGVKVVRIPRVPRLEKRERSLSFKLHVWRWMWRHRHQLRQADIIHIHDVFWWIWPIYLVIAPNTFITFHGWEGQYPVSWRARLQRWFANQLCQGVIHVGAWIQEFYGDQPDYVVYGGFNPDRLSTASAAPGEEKVSDPATDHIHLVFVGRLEAVNEVPTYLQLLKVLQDKQIPFRMTWVGDGSFREECQKLGTVTGMVEQPEKYIHTADLVFANSYLSMLTAQAMKVIVVAAYSNPLKQRYLETYPIQTGLVVGSTPEELADKLEQLGLDSNRWTHQAQRAAQQAQQLTWEKVTQTYLKLWRKRIAKVS